MSGGADSNLHSCSSNYQGTLRILGKNVISTAWSSLTLFINQLSFDPGVSISVAKKKKNNKEQSFTQQELYFFPYYWLAWDGWVVFPAASRTSPP